MSESLTFNMAMENVWGPPPSSEAPDGGAYNNSLLIPSWCGCAEFCPHSTEISGADAGFLKGGGVQLI